MSISEGKKVNIVDYYTMRKMTESLVAKGVISQEIMDITMEQENNQAYDKSAYAALLEKKKSTSFTVTAKQWIEQTKAIGITSKQGGTFVNPMIACNFATLLSPKSVKLRQIFMIGKPLIAIMGGSFNRRFQKLGIFIRLQYQFSEPSNPR